MEKISFVKSIFAIFLGEIAVKRQGPRSRKNRVQGFEGSRGQVQKSKVQKSKRAEVQKGFKDSRIQGFKCNAPDTEDSEEKGSSPIEAGKHSS